jgi:hypothetical protein
MKSDIELYKQVLYNTKYTFRGRMDRSPTDNITDFLTEVEENFEKEKLKWNQTE